MRFLMRALVCGLFCIFGLTVHADTLPGASEYLFMVVSNGNDVTRQGSGVLVQSNKILTNCHVVADAERVVAVRLDGKKVNVTGISADAFHDACTLQIDASLPGAVRQSRFTSDGDEVVAVGYPSAKAVFSAAKVVNANAKLNGEDVILTSNYCAPGISGGPLFNKDGELVGLLFAGNSVTKSCAAIPNYLLQRSVAGHALPIGSGVPKADAGSAYHKDWNGR